MIKDFMSLWLVAFACLLSGKTLALQSQVMSHDMLDNSVRNQCDILPESECSDGCVWGQTDAGTEACLSQFTSYMQTGGNSKEASPKTTVKVQQLDAAGLFL